MPVPQQSGQSSQVSMNLLAPPKKEVWPEPPQPGQGVVFFGVDCFFSLIICIGSVEREKSFAGRDPYGYVTALKSYFNDKS